MTIRLFATAVLTLFTLHATTASALTTEQFAAICATAPGECSEHPTLHAYVGGALDLLATLQEETDYLTQLYCKEPKELFDVPAIIRFMQAHSGEKKYAQRNAMLVLVLYFEQQGGCKP